MIIAQFNKGLDDVCGRVAPRPTEGVILSGAFVERRSYAKSLLNKVEPQADRTLERPVFRAPKGQYKLLLNLSGKRTEEDYGSNIGVSCTDAIFFRYFFYGH